MGAAYHLQAKTIGTSLVFAVGNKEVPSFRMIERHYFRSQEIFDFFVSEALVQYWMQGQAAEIL